MTRVTDDPHFLSVPTWEAARSQLTFRPRVPRYTAGHRLQSLVVHVRDHRRRELPPARRTLEGHYGVFVLSQSRPGAAEARRQALAVVYGADGHHSEVAGRPARAYELGPQVRQDDIDGRSPAVVSWHDGEMSYLLASDRMEVAELLSIAGSMYD